MKIKGIEGMTVAELQDEVVNGGKFVIYTYCISFLLISFKRSSSVYFIKSAENAFVKGSAFSLISLFFGWWGIPWGIIYTFESLLVNLNGGREVTQPAMVHLQSATGGHVFEFEPSAAATC